MKDKLEALARLEFGDKIKRINYDDSDENFEVTDFRGFTFIRNYLDPTEGHGHLQRLIDGLDDDELRKYQEELISIFIPLCDGSWYTANRLSLKATVEQKAEAFLRAKGLWKEKKCPSCGTPMELLDGSWDCGFCDERIKEESDDSIA